MKITNKKGNLKRLYTGRKFCTSPQHKPPSYIVLKPGTYNYTCPNCGESITFTVPEVYLKV